MVCPSSGPDGSPRPTAAGVEEQAPKDPVLAALLTEPFRLIRPQVQTVPFVFASGHSGRRYPQSLIAQSRLDPLTLRRSEDAFVDELFSGVASLGAPLIAAEFPRAYCDVNRASGELDSGMFDSALDIAIDAPSPRVAAGLGVIPRIVRDGAEIYAGKLSPREADLRLSGLYRPYHAALAELAAETVKKFGVAVVVDCHSMPSALSVPDIVLGDRYGASAPLLLTGWAENVFVGMRFSIARNAPYAGGYTTLLYGKAAGGLFGLQIEINRALYLDEDRIQRKTGFDALKKRLTDTLVRLTAIDPALLGGRAFPLAAE
ncbi:MAG TPA: N-formylglutamate amidohydrolase [Rhizomicrobium sp.]|nr:N-formylglutamate amidohydrolase [Rhizomicrobium sp.]